MFKNVLSLITVILVFGSFKSEKSNSIQSYNSQNLNISFLLDLSDRIDTKKNSNISMEYYQRDIQYIKSVEKAFISHVKQKKIMSLNDQIQVFFDPTPSNPEINKLSKQLRINFDKNSSKNQILDVDKIFSDIPPKIYQYAIKEKKFIGSDIWRFFQKNVKDYCIQEKHRNILVILTDGYMFHKNSKFNIENKTSYITPSLIQTNKLNTADYKVKIKSNNFGFIPASDKLQNLEVLVLGINPSKNNPFEEEVITQYWSDWFKSMGINKFNIKSAELPSDLDPVITKIIIGK
ncbi:hypothetical protein [Pedobacter sp.]|uniref:hypothetical protein n=1 Tax=Pedobacter sp. TaxID=1411316 RepID=UPI003BAB30C3